MRTILLICLLLFVTACAGVQRYPTGLPATAAQKFYFHMEQEAEDRGLQYTTGDDLVITREDGWLRYSVWEDEISLTITVNGAKEMEDAAIDAKQAELKALSDELVAAARERAEEANAFEP